MKKMSSIIACLQRRQCPYTFRRDNVFSHCMPSKGNNDHHLLSKTTMSSVIACLQMATMSLSTFRRRQCLQSLHAFKRRQWPSFAFQRQQCLQSLHAFRRQQCSHLHFKDDNVFSHCMPSKGDIVFICILKTTMSSPQKLQYLFPICCVGLDVHSLYASFYKKKEWWVKMKMKMKMKMN